MAKALETYIDRELTPLQKAALKRIESYRQELEEKGCFVRSAMELEFFTETPEGKQARAQLKLGKVGQHLRKALPGHVQQFGYECITDDHLQPDNFGKIPQLEVGEEVDTSHYELNLIDPADVPYKHVPANYDPGRVAAASSFARAHSLPDALCSASCLVTKGSKLVANFQPKPYSHNSETSSLHVNMSLYDREGHNLFERQELRNKAAAALIDIQHEAAAAFLPSPDSLKRIGANSHAPYRLGVTRMKNDADGLSSVRIVVHAGKGPDGKNESRLENRLPGADADPFVAMALTLAAMVKATRSKEVPLTPYFNSLLRSHGELEHRLSHSKELPELLGKEFYGALVKEYAPRAARSR